MSGEPQPTATNKLIEQVVRYCREHNPEALDQIFDSLPVGRTIEEYRRLNDQVLAGVLAKLGKDTDTLSWFCAYIAQEINRSEDNERPRHPVKDLAKLLIEAGMLPFSDFMPYPGRRIIVINPDKFESLPEAIRAKVQQAFSVMEHTGEELHQVNEALLGEMTVQE